MRPRLCSTALLALIAGLNEALIYLLFSIENRAGNLAGFLPIMAIGAVPFLLTAALIAWAIFSSAQAREGDLPIQQLARRISGIAAIGLPLTVLCGL